MISSTESFLQSTIDNAIKAAIEDQVRHKMPEIVAAACANVIPEIHLMVAYERLGADLRITVLNAYKQEAPK